MTDFSAYFNPRWIHVGELSKYPIVNDPKLIVQNFPSCPQCKTPSNYSMRHVVHNKKITWTRCLESINSEECVQQSFCTKCKMSH